MLRLQSLVYPNIFFRLSSAVLLEILIFCENKIIEIQGNVKNLRSLMTLSLGNGGKGLNRD